VLQQTMAVFGRPPCGTNRLECLTKYSDGHSPKEKTMSGAVNKTPPWIFVTVNNYYTSIFSDRRRKLVGAFFLLSWLLTGILFYIARQGIFGGHTEETERGIFFAWCGELLFFTLIGLAIALVSLEKPSDPSKEDIRYRTKIFFGAGGIPDPVVTHFLNELYAMSVFAEQASWDLEIQEYRPDLHAYRVQAYTEYHFKNPISDQPVSFEMAFGFTPDEIPALPDEAERGR
jgi:hypothetical protein